MADCGCGGSSNARRAARSAGKQAGQPAGQPADKNAGGPQDRGSSYYSRAGKYTGPPSRP